MSAGNAVGWSSFGRRIAGAMRFDKSVYRNVSRDPGALPQAMAVILLSSLASAIVFLVDHSSPSLSVDVDWGSYPITRESNVAAALAGGLLDGSWGLIIWAAQAALIWVVWNRFAHRRRTFAEIATPLGFANAPLIVFALLELVPVIGRGLGVVGLLWTLAASVVALREGLDTGWGRAVLLLAASVLVLLPLSVALSRLT
jgi:hypothetical protein